MVNGSCNKRKTNLVSGLRPASETRRSTAWATARSTLDVLSAAAHDRDGLVSNIRVLPTAQSMLRAMGNLSNQTE